MRLDHDEFVCCPKQPPSVTPKTPDNPTSGVKIDPVTPNEAAAFDLSLKITASGLQNDAFLLANEDQLNQNLKQIVEDFPTVQPYFDVACNTCPWLLKALSRSNIRFLCQNKAEIQHILSLDIASSNILYSNPAKVASHLKFATGNQVGMMSFGSFGDLKKIQKAVGSGTAANFGLLLALQTPTGCPETDVLWLDLLSAAKEAGLNVCGVSFENLAFNKMTALTKMAFTIGRSLGHDMKIVDLGRMEKLDENEVNVLVTKHLKDVDHQLIGHIGVDFVENVFTSAAQVIGMSDSTYNDSMKTSIVINDGIFNNFGRLMYDEDFNLEEVKVLRSGNAAFSKKALCYDIFGSSGDDMDTLGQEMVLYEAINEKNWLFFNKMGAFSYSLQSEMESVKLPARFGNFWLFSPIKTSGGSGNGMLEESKLKTRNIDLRFESLDEDGLEVIFLDIEDNDFDFKITSTDSCLDLLRAFPSLASYQDGQFWEDFYTDTR